MDLAAVYSREIDGKALTLAPSGWTYRRTFVLYDKETETLWYPLKGTRGLTGISGYYRDQVLPELDSSRTTWERWRDEHPETKFMRYPRQPTRFPRRR